MTLHDRGTPPRRNPRHPHIGGNLARPLIVPMLYNYNTLKHKNTMPNPKITPELLAFLLYTSIGNDVFLSGGWLTGFQAEKSFKNEPSGCLTKDA
jgi:hypothetical protein